MSLYWLQIVRHCLTIGVFFFESPRKPHYQPILEATYSCDDDNHLKKRHQLKSTIYLVKYNRPPDELSRNSLQFEFPSNSPSVKILSIEWLFYVMISQRCEKES